MSSCSLLAMVLTLLAFSLSACHPARLIVVVPESLTHDIGLWSDADLICVALSRYEAAYVSRRCVPMKTIRTLILQTQIAGLRD